jgi:DNA-binding NarL/FixJ family response regulator
MVIDRRVVVVDDDPDVREMLRHMLELVPGLTVVAEAGDADDGIRQVAQHQPEVVVLDHWMPGRNGLDALPDIRAACPRCFVVMFTATPDTVYLRLGDDATTAVVAKGGVSSLNRLVELCTNADPAA